MSEEDHNTQPLDTQPLDTQPLDQASKMRKTASVPLRKETVRVTLKATPAGAKQPSAPQPSTPAVKAPTAMSPDTQPQAAKREATSDIPDVTSAVPLKQETMRVTLKSEGVKAPAPAPTVPLNTGGPKVPTPAPTVPLNVGAAAGAPTPLATQPLGNASQPLPKATVQLQQTQPLEPSATPAPQSAAIQTAEDEEEPVKAGNNLHMILVAAAFALSLFLLFAQFQRASIWVDENENGEYSAIFSGLK